MNRSRPTRQLRDGMMVTYKCGWIVPCSYANLPRGVWRTGMTMVFANGSVVSFPSGVQVSGTCYALKDGLP